MRKLEKLEYFLLSAVVFVGFIVRLYKIENPLADWHSWRQADTASVTRTYVERGVDLLYPRYQDISTTQTGVFNPEGYRMVEFPIFNAVHAYLTKIPLFSLEVWGRLLSIISSLISGVVLFFIGKKFIGQVGGILTTFFFLLIPYNVYFSRVILPEPMAVTFGLLSIFLFVQFLEKDKSTFLLMSAIFFALSILIKPFTLFYGVPMAYLAVKKYGFANLFKKIPMLLALDVAIVPFFLWRIWINRYPEGIPHFLWAFNGDQIRFRPSFWMWIFGERLSRLILGGTGMLPFSFGVLFYKKNKAFVNMFLLGMLLYVVVIATANVRHDYYQTITIPAISLALASGTLVIWEAKGMHKLFARSLLVASIAVSFITGALQVREFYKINHPEIIEAGMAVDRVTPKDALVVAPYNGDTAFLYQTKRWGWPVVDRPLPEIIQKGADFYVSVNFDSQTNEFIQKFATVERTSNYVILDLNKKI
jgi:4-amino-4-deoxy-L-arabinose transferase-like glycosyltransferase